MTEIAITIAGQTPSHKNSKQITRFRNGRTALINNRRYLAWKNPAILQAKTQTIVREITSTEITATFFVEDRRHRDLDNMLASVLDALVGAQVLADDNVFILPKITAIFGGIDKEKPRCDIILDTKTDETREIASKDANGA